MHDDFWRHPIRSSDEGVASGFVVRELSGDTKVSEFDLARGCEEDVGGFDISMNLVLLAMKVVETQKKLMTDDGDVRLGKGSRLEEVQAGATFKIFHDCNMAWE